MTVMELPNITRIMSLVFVLTMHAATARRLLAVVRRVRRRT
jgi:hypothetical protein